MSGDNRRPVDHHQSALTPSAASCGRLHRRHYGPEGDPLILVAQGARGISIRRCLNVLLIVRWSVITHRQARNILGFSEAILNASSRSKLSRAASVITSRWHRSSSTAISPSSIQWRVGADSFTLAISHKDGERIVIDAIREVRPPFSPDGVIDEFASLLKTYRIGRVIGDRYAGEFPRELFRKYGIEYRCAEKPKSDLYRDLLPLLNAGRIVLPKSDRLVNQICGLERRTAR